MSLSSDNTVMTMPVAPAYQGGNGGFGGWGGDWASWIILFLIFGMFGWGGYGGFGGGNGGTNGPGFQGWATRADINEGFALNNLQSGITSIQQGICSLGYDQLAQMNGINTNILHTGFGIQNAVQQGTVAGMQNTNAIQAQLAQCCCDNEKGQMQITNSMDSGFCQTNYNLATNTNAIIQNAHSDTDRVIAKLDAMEMSRKDETIAALRSQVDALNLAQSQANQNNYLVNTLRPCPTPAYLTCNPWASQAAYGSCGSYGNCGCGC